MIPAITVPLNVSAAAAAAACPLGITTAMKDGSANDRATKRLRGVRAPGTTSETDDSNHTSSTSDTSGSEDSAYDAAEANRQKQVNFAPVTAIHGTDWTRDEVDSGWYSKDELAVFKQDRKALVKVLKRVRFDLSQVDTTIHCLRGYEAYFSIQANKEYKYKRQMVWKAVLQEQQRQRFLGKQDATLMQLVSSHATQWARDTATELGMQDAQVALSIFLDYMQEQQEENNTDDHNNSNNDYDDEDGEVSDDDTPIAVNWDEAFGEDEVLSLQPELDFNEPLQLSSQEIHRARMDVNNEILNGSFSSQETFGNDYDDAPLPELEPFPLNNNNNDDETTLPLDLALKFAADNQDGNHTEDTASSSS